MDNKEIRRIEIARNVFKEVLDANLHQSEISAHLLVLGTLITGAAVALFAIFLEYNISFIWMGVNLTIVFFLVYISLTLSATILIIENIGPSFQTEGWPPKEIGPKGPKSILFFKFIQEIDIDTWINTFCKKENSKESEEFLKTDELQNKFVYDCMVESYQLAKKTHGKVRRNLLAHLLFYISFYLLLLMAYSGIITYFDAWDSVTIVLILVISVFFLYITYRVAKKYKGELSDHFMSRIRKKLKNFLRSIENLGMCVLYVW